MGCGASAPSRDAEADGRPRLTREPTREDLAATRLQSTARGASARSSIDGMHANATTLQAASRGRRDRGRAARIAIEAEIALTDHAAVKEKKGKLVAVNGYSISKELGKGAFGQVYLARRSEAGYALKVLSRSILRRKRVGRHGSAYDSVMGEIAVMKKVSHPSLVRLHEVIDDPEEDMLFLVMELVSGGDLSEPIAKRRAVPEPELRVWLRSLFLGLEHLHLCGVCHRDIKPENILWDPQQRLAKLTDFGVSGFFTTGIGGDFIKSNAGTFTFFAPEMCRAMHGAGYSAKAADFWACGVTLYMWLYHEPPFSSDNAPGLLLRIANEPIPYPADARASAPLLKLLHGLLERTPKGRHGAREIRRSPFLTTAAGGASEPLDPPVAKGVLSFAKADLQKAVERIKLLDVAAGGDGLPEAAEAAGEEGPPEPGGCGEEEAAPAADD